MSRIDPRLLDAMLRTDFATFARAMFNAVASGETLEWNWHLDAICHHLELVRQGEIKRLIIEVPPRSLKSYLSSIAFPAFCLGRDPTEKIITVSYSLDLAIKHANDFRTLVKSARFLRLFPHLQGVTSKDTETEFTTPQRGYRYSTSSGGTLTGRGANLLIVDDPMKSDDASSHPKRAALQHWFGGTLYTRLNSKKDGTIILVMQRLHLDDLAGQLRQQGGWTILSLPAIAPIEDWIQTGTRRWHERKAGDVLHPIREPRPTLDDIRSTLGSYQFSAQYLQEPVPPEGQLVKWKWFKTYRKPPETARRIVQSWDVATKAEELSDYSVCTTWAVIGRDYYLLHLYRGRLDFPDLRKKAVDLARQWRTDSIVIEDKATGTALIQQLRSERLIEVPKPIAYMPKLDKVSRMSAESATIEAGHVYVPQEASWLTDLRLELAQFPNGRFDDQVDSISQFLGWARTHRSPPITTMRIR